MAFWLCLMAGVALYAIVALSPKLLELLTLEQRMQANQHYLVDLEKRVSRLKRLNALHSTDRALIRERARAELGIHQPGEERIKISGSLTLSIAGEAPSPPRISQSDLPWYAALLRIPAESWVVGSILLGAAAILVVFSFTVFVPGQTEEAQ